MLPIKAIKLRAGFLLLLFTLMLISSNSLITEIYAGETLEESFKATPLPFWEIDNQNVLTQYGTYTQDILLSYGNYLEDFNDISDWILSSGNEKDFDSNNGIAYFDSSPNIDDQYEGIKLINQQININGFIKIRHMANCSFADYFQIRIYSGSNFYFWSIQETTYWQNSELNIKSDFTLSGSAFDIADTIHLLIRIDVGEQVQYSFDYMQIYQDYQEDMSDISDWSFDSSINLGVGDYSFTTAGGIGDLYFIPDEHANEGVTYKTTMNYLITEFTRFEIKSKVTDSHIVCGTRITGTGLNDWPTSCGNTNWQTQTADITDHAGKIITTLLFYITDNPDTLPAFDGSGLIDYINIWEVGGSLNVSIPIEQFKNHKFEFMIDTDDLTDTTKLEFGIFQNYDSMNYDFSLENQIFEQRDFSFNYSGYNYLRFKIDLKYSTNLFKITGYDENNSKLFDNIIYEYVRKTGNQFIISSVNFTGWNHLYYFSGNINYETIWKETAINQDPNIDNYLLSASALNDDLLTSHQIIYNRFISNFQFMRSNMLLYTEISLIQAKQLGASIEIQFYYPDGTEFYRVEGIFKRYSIDMTFEVKIYENDLEIYSASCGDYDAGVTQEGTVKFAVWRTQDNYLGVFFIGDDFLSFDYGTPRFMSNKTLENFQANITITYFSDNFNTGYQNFILELDGFELGYGGIDGVAEPHFSSTWWEYIPILGPIITAFMLVGAVIVSAIESGFAPLFIIIDSSINTVVSAIGDIAGAIWALFEGALNDIGLSLDSMASDIWNAFDSAISGIANVLDNVYSTLADIFTSIEGIVILIEIIDTVIDNISTGIASLITGLNDLTGIVTTISNIVTSINTAIDTVSTIVSNVLTALTNIGTVIDTFYGAFVVVATVIDTVSAIVNNVYTTLQNIATNFSAWVASGITTALVPAIIAGIESVIDATFALWEYQLNLVGTALGWGNVGTFLFDFTGTVVLAVPSWLAFLIGIMSFLVSILVWVNLMWAKYGAMFIMMGTLFVALDFTSALLTMDDEVIAECVGKYLGVLEKIVTFMYNIISTLLNAIWGILPF